MVAPGRQGPWQPKGSGLLVGVIVLSVLALLGHGGIALTLLRATQTSTSGSSPVAGPTTTNATTPGPTPAPATASSTTSATVHIDRSCLVRDNPPTNATIPAGDPFGTDLTHLGSQAELQRLYAVDDRGLTAIDGAGPVRECDRQLWQVVLVTTPSHLRPLVKELLVFDADLSNPDQLSLGDAVPADGTDPSRWRLTLSLNVGNETDVAVAVAHEVGHLMTLNPDQMATPQPTSCDTLDPGLGCLDATSYLVEFFLATWTKPEGVEWAKANRISDDAKRDQALQDLYSAHHASFVNSAAAVDPSEDFAESFALWCAFDPANPRRNDFIEGDKTDGALKLRWMDKGSSNFYRAVFGECQDLHALTG